MSGEPFTEVTGSSAAGQTLRREIAPLLAGYWAFGQYWGVWVILVFEFLRDHHISEGRIGVDYTILSVVSVLVMVFVAPRIQPLSLRTTVPLALASLGVGAVLQAAGPSGLVILAFAIVGLGNALIDVFLNVAAQRVEVRTRRPVLQWLHASYALGGVTGALSCGFVLRGNVSYRAALAIAAAGCFLTAAWNLWAAPREPSPEAPRERSFISVFRRAPALLIPSLVVLCAFLVEGSMDTWSGLFLRRQLDASAMIAAVAFAVFACTMFLGRLFAGRTLFALGHRRTIIVAGIGSATGGAIAALTSSPVVAAAAFLLLGFSLSSAAPAAFGLVEGSGEDPTSAIAAVTTVGYSGFIWSPPLLGWVAEVFSLRATMLVQVMATLGVLAAGMATRNPSERVPVPGAPD